MRPLPQSLVLLFLLGACSRGGGPARQAVETTSLPKIAITDKTNMLYTFAAGGQFKTVSKLADVPKAQRGWVRVVDLNMKQEARKDHQMVYVADLSKARADGTYPYVVLSRVAFESPGKNSTGAGGKPAPGKAGAVILYATSWCGACKSAREYLTTKGIPFVEKDIEKDKQAAEELLQKASKAGVTASGVPVLDVGGTLVQGFDPARVEALLGRQGKP